MRYLTISEAAVALGVSKDTVRRWALEGRLPCHQAGARGDRLFDPRVIAKLARKTRKKKSPKGRS